MSIFRLRTKLLVRSYSSKYCAVNIYFKNIIQIFLFLRLLKSNFNPSLLGVENRNLEIESIVLEFVQGENLDTLVARNQGLSEPLIRVLTKQIFGAIHFIHSKGIIHRDVKVVGIGDITSINL